MQANLSCEWYDLQSNEQPDTQTWDDQILGVFQLDDEDELTDNDAAHQKCPDGCCGVKYLKNYSLGHVSSSKTPKSGKRLRNSHVIWNAHSKRMNLIIYVPYSTT